MRYLERWLRSAAGLDLLLLGGESRCCHQPPCWLSRQWTAWTCYCRCDCRCDCRSHEKSDNTFREWGEKVELILGFCIVKHLFDIDFFLYIWSSLFLFLVYLKGDFLSVWVSGLSSIIKHVCIEDNWKEGVYFILGLRNLFIWMTNFEDLKDFFLMYIGIV